MSQFLQLNHGQRALVDNDDYERCKHLKWRCDVQKLRGRKLYYPIQVRKEGKKRTIVRLSRLVANAGERQKVIHINKDPLDCRKSNLKVIELIERKEVPVEERMNILRINERIRMLRDMVAREEMICGRF